MKIACLFKYYFSISRRHIHYGEVFEIRQLFDLIGGNVITKYIELPIAVAQKINGISHPCRLYIIATSFRLWNFYHALFCKRKLPDLRDRSSPVMLPLSELIGVGIIGDRSSVRSKAGVVRVGNPQLGCGATRDRYGIELKIAIRKFVAL